VTAEPIASGYLDPVPVSPPRKAATLRAAPPQGRTGRVRTRPSPEGNPWTGPPRLRSRPVPVREPNPAVRVVIHEPVPAVPATQGTLPLVLPIPTPTQPMSDDHEDGELPGESPALPEPREWAMGFVQATAEVLAGLRSPAQLVRWTTPEVYASISRRGALAARARRAAGITSTPPVLRTIRVDTSRPGICEVAAVIADRERVRAIAFRLEGLDRRWRVTAIEIG